MTCSVIQDLLPLYIDGLTSQETEKLVSAHLQACPQCRTLWEQMAQPMEASKEPSCDYVSAIRKQKRRTRIRTGLICLLLLLAVFLGWWVYMETHFTVGLVQVDSTNPAFILKKQPLTELTQEEIILADALYTHPVILESFTETGYRTVSPSQVEDLLAQALPEDALIQEITVMYHNVIVFYQLRGTQITVDYIDGDRTGNVDLIQKTVSTPDKNGKVTFVYASSYEAATQQTQYQRWRSFHKWFGFLEHMKTG